MSLSLTTWTMSGKADVSNFYYPGITPCSNILKLTVNAFAQKTKTMQKYEKFMENCLLTRTKQKLVKTQSFIKMIMLLTASPPSILTGNIYNPGHYILKSI